MFEIMHLIVAEHPKFTAVEAVGFNWICYPVSKEVLNFQNIWMLVMVSFSSYQVNNFKVTYNNVLLRPYREG